MRISGRERRIHVCQMLSNIEKNVVTSVGDTLTVLSCAQSNEKEQQRVDKRSA